MQVAFKDVVEILEKCACGYELKRYPHSIAVLYQEKTAYLPKGGHGKQGNHQIEVGHVRRMARMLDIEECAKAFRKPRL